MPVIQNVALIVSHPAHAVMVAGLVQRYRPRLLILGNASAQKQVVEYGLSKMGIGGNADYLDLSDADSYQGVIRRDYSFHKRLADHIYHWINEYRPATVIGDAFELSNFQHDLTRFLIDCALKKMRRTEAMAPSNLEIPICCRTKDGTDKLDFQVFPFGAYESFFLTPEERRVKRHIAEWAAQQDAFIAKVCKIIPDWTKEIYRDVPNDRDYSTPPEGLKLHYDDRGIEEVRSGNYETAISFKNHFVPLVEAIGPSVS